MDFERGVLRAFFLDYPLSKVIEFLKKDNPRFDKEYLNLLPELLRRRMKEYTLFDTQNIKDKVKKSLLSLLNLLILISNSREL